jgi:hypothetical protein
MGSWLWVKKNPRQLFSRLGSFNPIKPHRLRRILRRHTALIDFLHRAVASRDPWTVLTDERRRRLTDDAYAAWYAH